MPLSQEAYAAWRSFLEAHARVIRQLDTELIDNCSLSVADFDVLAQLAEGGGRLRMADLADRLLISRSGLTRRVDRLNRAGCVERQPSLEDRRGSYAVLTTHGRDLLRQAVKIHDGAVDRLFVAALTEEQIAALQSALEVVAEGAVPVDGR